MGKVVKSVTSIFGGAPKIPDPPPPPKIEEKAPTPIPDDQATKNNQARIIAARRRQSGRLSTILTSSTDSKDTLG